MKHYTSIEQSRKLIELGLKPETADMCYEYDQYADTKYCHIPTIKMKEFEYKGSIPCWSVGALLEALPKGIDKWDDRDRSRKIYELNLFRSYYHCCSYTFGPALKLENHNQLLGYGGDTWIEAVYNIALKLAERGWLTCD